MKAYASRSSLFQVDFERAPDRIAGGIEPLDVGRRLDGIVDPADRAHYHASPVDAGQQEVTGLRPRFGVREFETIGPGTPDLATCAGDKVIETGRPRMLEVVLVTRKHHSHARALEERHQLFHPARVVVLRARAVKRVMR